MNFSPTPKQNDREILGVGEPPLLGYALTPETRMEELEQAILLVAMLVPRAQSREPVRQQYLLL